MKNIWQIGHSVFLVMFTSSILEYRFNIHNDRDCLTGQNLHQMNSAPGSDYESCKQWCVDNDCAVFIGRNNKCYIKASVCIDNVEDSHVYLKVVYLNKCDKVCELTKPFTEHGT